jgi:hypothetical protein
MRRISLNARMAFEDQSSDEIEVALFYITHPDLDAPVRLSTDPTVRISDEPLMYATRSTWSGSDPLTEPFLFVVASAEFPSDLEDAPASATIVLENVDNDIAMLLRSFTDQPTIHMAVVLASSPDLVEVEFRGLKITSSEGNAGEVSMQVSRAPIEDETVPMDRFTKDRFPGLFR